MTHESSPRNTKVRGFTLVEIITVMGIVAILTALVIPAIVQAKRQGAEAAAISNLRQSGIGLLMYSDDYGGLPSLPRRPIADEVLAKLPTCDLRDYFRQDCRAASPEPHIGSFAYVRDDWVFGEEASWTFYLSVHESHSLNPVLLIDLFSSHKRHRPGNWFGEYYGNPHPDQIRVFEADGGVRLHHPESIPGIGYTWQTLFLTRN